MSHEPHTGRFERREHEHSDGRIYPFGLYLPPGYAHERAWPLILFLHGIGECGIDGLRHLQAGLPPAVLREPDRWPFIIVAPQKPQRGEEWDEHAEALFGLLDRIEEERSIDADRVHVTGLSQGGHGAWTLGAMRPERWASVVPICGYAAAPVGGWAKLEPDRAWDASRESGAIERIAGKLAPVPVWTFHGSADRVVPADLTALLADALRARGANCTHTIFSGVDHNSWDRAYAQEELTEFLGTTKRGAR